MVDIASLDTAARGAFSGCHNYVKNIETAYVGNTYSSVVDALDYYAIECVAKPALSKAPEWVSDNRVVSVIRNHQGISLAVGTALIVFAFVIWLHPKGPTVKAKDAGTPPSSPEPKAKNTTPPLAKKSETPEPLLRGEDELSFDGDLDSEESKESAGEPKGTTKAVNTTKADERERSEEESPTASGVREDEEESDGTISTSAKKNLDPLLRSEKSGVAGDLEHREVVGAPSSTKDKGRPAGDPSLLTTTTIADPSSPMVGGTKKSDD